MEPAENIPYAKRIVERMSEVFEPPLNYTKYSFCVVTCILHKHQGEPLPQLNLPSSLHS